MPIHLYQSQKAKRYLGNSIYQMNTMSEDQIDPLSIWYVDVFFISRERYLILTNPLTKLTFFLFRYSKKIHPDFLKAFQEGLTQTMTSAGIASKKYLSQHEVLVPYESSNRSASAHLSNMKQDYKWMIEHNHHQVQAPDDQAFYNSLAAEEITTYGGRDYDSPSQRFYHELLLRRWVD